MPNNTITPPDSPGQSEDMDYAEAQSAVATAHRRELIGKVTELRRQSDAAKERAKKAQERFERTVVLLASEKPEREDWYEHPGALPRKALVQASGLNTVALHRVMERYRKTLKAKAGKGRRR